MTGSHFAISLARKAAAEAGERAAREADAAQAAAVLRGEQAAASAGAAEGAAEGGGDIAGGLVVAAGGATASLNGLNLSPEVLLAASQALEGLAPPRRRRSLSFSSCDW
jgi:hypothetical protein